MQNLCVEWSLESEQKSGHLEYFLSTDPVIRVQRGRPWIEEWSSWSYRVGAPHLKWWMGTETGVLGLEVLIKARAPC